MKAYRYSTATATFVIYPANGWWGLMMDGRKINDYGTAEAAAYDVSAQNTGEPAWDFLEDAPDVPELLQSWECVDFDPQTDGPSEEARDMDTAPLDEQNENSLL